MTPNEAKAILARMKYTMSDNGARIWYIKRNEALDLAIELIEGCEQKRPRIAQDAKGIWMTCGKCGYHMKALMPNDPSFFHIPKYCSECGTKVKWDDA